MKELESINDILTGNEIPDFQIDRFNGVNLVLRGSFDFAYYYNLEIEFKQVSYLSLPVYFNLPFFRLANEKEINSISKLISLESEDIVYCIEAETSCNLKKIPFYIVALEVEVKHETKSTI